MSMPLVGHLDPRFIELMEEVKGLLRYVFQTHNDVTIPLSGTGSAGMEACLCNLIERDDPVLVCVNGFFGERMCDMVTRCGGQLARVDTEWGRVAEPDRVRKALGGRQFKVVAIVHAETSTGALQPLEEISKVVCEHGALLVADTVTSLGGHPVKTDEWQIDACYSATQKCLSCPPGLSPTSFSDRAMDRVRRRRTQVPSWYLDMGLLIDYWGHERAYHHTAPISANYALLEALRIIRGEGLDARYARHELNHRALVAGLEAMGLQLLVEERFRLWTLTTVKVPHGVQESRVRERLLAEYGIEIGGGLGPLKGRVWRVGLMGESSRVNNVLLFLATLEKALCLEGVKIEQGAGTSAAQDVYWRFQGAEESLSASVAAART
jgi:alanine-glyoxylate transaminase/serine-glyoxylate transaminase/serine-pyruvate transaminase